MSNLTEEQLERLREMIIGELSAFMTECPICKNRFKNYLYDKAICINCDRDQKIDSLLKSK